MTMTIEVRDLVLRYGDLTALDRVSFRLDAGKIHGLLGRNGSGKTSLLSVIAAFRRATSGEVCINGEPVFENPDVVRDLCFIRGAGDTVEHDWPADRVKDALAFAATFRPAWDADYAAALVDRFQLSPKKRIGQLSRGQRSALGVTLGLASRAPLTVFDESYLGMDAPSRYAFYDELLADFMANPRTFIISTHLIEEVSSLFEEVVIIDKGRLVLHEPADELRARGASVTGPAEAVARFAEGLTILGDKQLGPTRSVMVYGELDNGQLAAARDAGLELGPVALQDLFVHLTEARSSS